MIHDVDFAYTPGMQPADEVLLKILSDEAGLSPVEVKQLRLLKRSIDARGRKILIRAKYRIITEPDQPEHPEVPLWKNVQDAKPVHIIGAGPAGLFAALRLLELGLKPIILERGKDVRARRRDLVKITREGIVNPESNYCFGEGGAGTYSDGKLYTRSTKRGDVQAILKMLVAHGAHPDILADAHPHVGTNKLPGIIFAMRETIRNHGGEIHFETRVDDILVEDGAVSSLITSGGIHVNADHLILATGHSARDIYQLFYKKGWAIETKAFAMGVRVEHPQELINEIQYHGSKYSDVLPPASYNLVKQVGDHGVYSFCMCPGGIIAPCATGQGEVVTNGWSPSKRNNPFANSGIVVEIKEADMHAMGFRGSLAGLHFQQKLEMDAFEAGGGGLIAPAQRLNDFVVGKQSSTLPDCSYNPGISSAALQDILPSVIADNLKAGFKAFGKMMKGYLTNEAIVVGVESRSSSPLRIPRDPQTLEHTQIRNLYPCGEGAGYAGGIVSAAIDGMRCASQIALVAQR